MPLFKTDNFRREQNAQMELIFLACYREGVMQEYEIRVLNDRLSPSLFVKTSQLNDNAAIRAGRQMAEGQPFEVWRSRQCVYGASVPVSRLRNFTPIRTIRP